MFKDFTNEQLLKECDEVYAWGRVVGFQGKDEEAYYARYRGALVAEFHSRGFLYPGLRVDLQKQGLKPLLVAA